MSTYKLGIKVYYETTINDCDSLEEAVKFMKDINRVDFSISQMTKIMNDYGAEMYDFEALFVTDADGNTLEEA